MTPDWAHKAYEEIFQDILDHEPDDPNDPDTICIDIDALNTILIRRLLREE